MSTKGLTDPRNGSVRTGGGDVDTSMDGFDFVTIVTESTPADYFLISILCFGTQRERRTCDFSRSHQRSLGRC